MIDYIKEYGVTSLDFEYILHNLKPDVIELFALSENSVREVLDFYNKLGITSNLSKLIVCRPDLVLTTVPCLEELLKNIELNSFINIVDKSCEDLILLGI